MEKTHFYEFVNRMILPLFTGSYVAGEIESSSRDLEVALGKGNSVLLKPTKSDEYRVILKRGQPFKSFEVNLIKTILEEVSVLAESNLENTVYIQKLQNVVIEKALIDSITSDIASETIIGIISSLERWATRTYEGANVSMGIFVNLATIADDTKQVNYSEIMDREFFARITDGVSAFVEFDRKGTLIGYTNLKNTKSAPTISPYAFDRVARTCNDKRVGIVLTTRGEILIFYARQLMFAKRNGKWCVYSHDEIIRLLYTNVSYTAKQIRRAIYNTALDCSFGYMGACIIYLNKDKTKEALKLINIADIISESHFEEKKQMELAEANKLYNLNSTQVLTEDMTYEEYLTKFNCIKAKSIRNIIAGKKLYELDRKLLENLVGIDGATVVDFDGSIIAVGAILKIEAGSLGGGRLAATKGMAKYGVGIKVSQDGIMQGFSADKHGKVKQIFNVG